MPKSSETEGCFAPDIGAHQRREGVIALGESGWGMQSLPFMSGRVAVVVAGLGGG